MKTDHLELIRFVLEEAQWQPPERRARLYRALSRIAGDEEDENNIMRLADEVTQTDAHVRQFVFSFVQKNKAESSPDGDGKPNDGDGSHDGDGKDGTQ